MKIKTCNLQVIDGILERVGLLVFLIVSTFMERESSKIGSFFY